MIGRNCYDVTPSSKHAPYFNRRHGFEWGNPMFGFVCHGVCASTSKGKLCLSWRLCVYFQGQAFRISKNVFAAVSVIVVTSAYIFASSLLLAPFSLDQFILYGPVTDLIAVLLTECGPSQRRKGLIYLFIYLLIYLFIYLFIYVFIEGPEGSKRLLFPLGKVQHTSKG
jgi:hypothetical protein